MQELIALNTIEFDGSEQQTVNARELHEFLENGDKFATWIVDRINQFGFLENQDFVTFSENSEKGRPRKEYLVSTDMAKEAEANWSAYSAGKLVDKTLYNIRRERCCEFMAEGYRMDDLRRWRSLDQLINTPYHIEGFKIWGDYYRAQYAEAAKTDKTYELIYGVDNPSANVSSPELSDYLRPYQIARTLAYDGFTWKMAHYLNPIAIKHFQLTSEAGGDYSDSPIYQNPGWPLRANEAAEE